MVLIASQKGGFKDRNEEENRDDSKKAVDGRSAAM
jgi:hypothetical protein